MAWTKDRLQEVIRDRLAGMKLVVVANREPYIHVRDGEEVKCMSPASGLTTALDPVMRVCHGVWVAHGSGDADREVSDEKGRIQVPPGDPSYTLRRVWLTKEQEQGYYYGFSNDALRPLCHIAYAIDEFAEALYKALTMPEDEQENRMIRLREKIADNNVYRWAALLLSEAVKRSKAVK